MPLSLLMTQARAWISPAPLLWGLVLLGASAPLPASDELPSLLSVEWSAGDDGRRDLYLDLDLAIGGPRLLFSVAQTHIDNEFSNYTTQSFLVGMVNDPLRTLNYGVELEQWGRAEHINSTTVRGLLAWNSLDWSLAVRPQWREITLATSDLCRRSPACPADWRIESHGVRIDANYYWQYWGFTLGYAVHDYDRDLAPLASNPRAIRLFSPLALELAMGFEDYGIGAGLRYAFRSVLLSLDEYRSVSAVDGLASWVTSVRLSIDLDRQWRLRLNGGLLRMPAISGGSILYAGLGAAYSW